MTDVVKCLDYRDGGGRCEGQVEYRLALSTTGRSFSRCDFHWKGRLAEQERILQDYPDSPCPPSWFDPLACGETWEDDL